MVGAPIDLQKIDDVSVGQAVVEIAQGAAQYQSQGNLQKAVSDRAPNAICNHNDRGKSREDGKQNGFHGRTDAGEDSEGDSCILYIRYVEKAVYNRCRFMQVESALNQGFGRTVKNQDSDD